MSVQHYHDGEAKTFSLLFANNFISFFLLQKKVCKVDITDNKIQALLMKFLFEKVEHNFP